MSNPDRLLREAQAHAETLIEDRGLANARAWAIHCANRSTDGFWSRVVMSIEAIDEAEQANVSECDACGEYKPDCEDVTYQGMDTHACAQCRGDETRDQ
jgi:hypothetical protein